MRSLKFWLVMCSTLVSMNSVAAGYTLAPGDSNSRITVENAVVSDGATTLLFFTWPDLGDPNSGKPCPLNYYSVTLKPGLATASADVVAQGVCGGLFQKSALQDDGDALIIIRDRLERWRAGKQIDSDRFSSIDAVSKLGVSTDMAGGQFYDIASGGHIVIAVQAGDHTRDVEEYRGVPLVVTGLQPDGERLWEVRFSQSGAAHTVEQVTAGSDGSALLYTQFLASGLSLSAEATLHFISATGSTKQLTLNKTGAAPDLLNMGNMSPQDLQKTLEQQQDSKPEAVSKLKARSREGGGYDVLFFRKSRVPERQGHYLYRIGPSGDTTARISLNNRIERHGVENWFDFLVTEDQLILLSKVSATQHGINARRKKYPQNAVSRIDLKGDAMQTHLIPLDQRYLQAAMNAGDAEIQYLDGLPGGDPVLLSTLAGKPLVVSVGWLSGRQVLRLHEAGEELALYTQAMDEHRAKQANQASRQQRKVE